MSILIPVIHHIDCATTRRNAALCIEAGCEYVSLIQMDGKDILLDAAISTLQNNFPKLEIIVNRLSSKIHESVMINSDREVHTWADDGDVSSSVIGKNAKVAESSRNLFYEWAKVDSEQFVPRIFCSIAFKYQKEENNPSLAALNAHNLGFIPTTSGPATGIAADIKKIKKIAEALPSKCLAIASGISAENIEIYRPYAKYFFVNTSISRDYYVFDKEKLNELAKIAQT